MRLFPEPPPPAPKADGPAPSMGERVARLSRQAPVATSGRKGMAMAIIGLIAVGGVVVTFATGESSIAKGVRRRHEQAQREAARAKEELPTPPSRARSSEKPLPTPAPEPASPPPPAGEPGVDLAAMAAAIAFAEPAQRPVLRMGALQWYAGFVDDPRSQRTILIDAARLAPDMSPEEEPAFATITKSAAQHALRSPDAAGAAVLYLGALRDRGGADAVLALEGVVLDEARPLELRVAAARALPDEARLRVLKDLDARARKELLRANPDLKDVSEQALRALTHPALRAALR